jgi:hypothetical protein
VKPWAYEQILERRRKLLHLVTVGVKTSDAVKQVCEDFDCTRSTVWRDWELRDEWIPTLLQLSPEQKDTVVREALAQLKEATHEAYVTYLETNRGMARVAAIREYREAVIAEIELRQKLGLLPSEPLRVEQRIVMLQGRFVRVDANGKPVHEESSAGSSQELKPAMLQRSRESAAVSQ